MHTLGQYRGTVVSCRYAVPRALWGLECREKLRKTFESAIARTVLEHPLLQVGLIGANSRKPAWTPLESIDFRHHVEWKSVEDVAELEPLYKDVMQHHLDAEFTNLESQPCWRITILHRSAEAESLQVVYSWNHANHDGMGGKIFHQYLLKYLNETSNDDNKKALPFLKDRILKLPAATIAERFPPAQQDVTKFPISADYIFKELWHARPAILGSDRSTQATWAPIRPSTYKTEFRTFSLNRDDLARVLVGCRAHKTTLTGLFHALCFATLTAQLDKREAPAFVASTALNMRPFLPSRSPAYPWLEPNKTLANLVSSMEHRFGKEIAARMRCLVRDNDASNDEAPLDTELKTLIWQVAATVRSEIETRISLGIRNDITGMMKFVSDWRTYVQELSQKPRGDSWRVTNLGVLDGTLGAATPESQRQGQERDRGSRTDIPYGSWSIDHAEFVLSAEMPAVALVVAPIAVKGGDIVVSFSWQDCAIEAAFGERFVANIEKLTRQLATAS